jgi:EF hand
MKYRIRYWATGSALLFFILALHSQSSAHTDVGDVSPGAVQSMETTPENKKCATFSCVDTDRDNAVSRKELTNYGDPSLDFDEIDKDDDDSLSMDEWNGRDGIPPPTNG